MTYCNCNNRHSIKNQIGTSVFYVCSKNLGGCGKEIKKFNGSHVFTIPKGYEINLRTLESINKAGVNFDNV